MATHIVGPVRPALHGMVYKMQPPIGETLTRADNPLLGPVLEAAQEIGLGGADLGDMLALLEKGQAIFARFVPLLERAGETIAKMRGLEAQGQGQAVQGDQGPGAAQGQGADPFYADNPGLAPEKAPSAEQLPAPVAILTISPIKVYAKLLGVLGQLPSDMTVGKALEDAKSNKAYLLQVIGAALAEMASDDESSE